MTRITLSMRRGRAFTLIELMLVVAIAGIMSLMAVVTLQQTAQSSRERGAARGVSAIIKRARSLAMQQHKLVEVYSPGVGSNALRLRACPAQFGTNVCAGGAAKVDVDGAFVNYGVAQESRGVTLTPAATDLEFNVLGMPTNPIVYDYTVDHPGTPGAVTIRVTAGGDVRVQ